MSCRLEPPATAPPPPPAALPEPLGWIAAALDRLRAAGLERPRRVRAGRQGATVELDGRSLVNVGSNDYLGYAGDVRLAKAAAKASCADGFGAGASPLVSGHSQAHELLERAIAGLLGVDAALVFPSGFAANSAAIAALVGPGDFIASDERNHASIIDGCRLSRAAVGVFPHRDVAALDALLAAAGAARRRLVVSDTLFSMDGTIANLPAIVALAENYGALTMMDDCHASGFLGRTGRGTHEHHDLVGRIDIITGTLGKALGGASGGFTASSAEIVALLRQRSRPYLFSNSVAPVIVAASLATLDLLAHSTELRDRLEENTRFFRAGLIAAGLTIKPGTHPIVPVMLGDAALSQRFAARMLEKGVYVVGFFYPVVPQGTARIRTQVSAAHSRADLEFAINAFAETKRELGL